MPNRHCQAVSMIAYHVNADVSYFTTFFFFLLHFFSSSNVCWYYSPCVTRYNDHNGSDLKKAYETAAWGTLLDFMEICRISCFFGKRDVSRWNLEFDGFRELSYEVLALPRAELWDFRKKTLKATTKTPDVVQIINRAVSWLREKLKTPMKAPWNRQILDFNTKQLVFRRK